MSQNRSWSTSAVDVEGLEKLGQELPQLVWEKLRACEDMQVVRLGLPEAVHEMFDALLNDLQERFNKSLSDVETLWRATEHLPDEEVICHAVTYDWVPPIGLEFLWACRKGDFFTEVHEKPDGKGHLRRRFFKHLKPPESEK